MGWLEELEQKCIPLFENFARIAREQDRGQEIVPDIIDSEQVVDTSTFQDNLNTKNTEV